MSDPRYPSVQVFPGPVISSLVMNVSPPVTRALPSTSLTLLIPCNPICFPAAVCFVL